jgi:hypothetical protein
MRYIQVYSCRLEGADLPGVCSLIIFRALTFRNTCNLDLDPIGAIVVSDLFGI